MTDFDNFTARRNRHRSALAKTSKMNKAIILDALAGAGITSVTVPFDGEGDSGQLEAPCAQAQDAIVPIPAIEITIHEVAWNTDTIAKTDATLSEALEALCYSYLACEQGGWENNDGAYGEFVFDVVKRTVTLDFNARFLDVINNVYSL